MLSSGTRIGTTRILSWLGEGSTGQSYHCESTEGERKGESLYVKLIHRENSEKAGFEDFFHQECQTLEQLEGEGIWPVREFGVMKWKHWIAYEWFEGESLSEEGEEQTGVVTIRSFADLIEHKPARLSTKLLLDFMIGLHRGLYRIHQSGLVHGNLKPSNILVRTPKDKMGEAWVAELGLFKISKFQGMGDREEGEQEVSYLNQDGRDSRETGDRFRPNDSSDPQIAEENWDIFSLGEIVRWAIKQLETKKPEWDEWKEWAEKAIASGSSTAFPSIAHSMQALPGVGDLGEYGVKVEEFDEESNVDLDALREKREREWALSEKLSTLRFRRNMTALAGALFALMFLVSTLYLFFLPAPWTEYSLDENTDSYRLGAGFWGGKAWGIVPPAYDDDGKGGQDVVGEWSKEDGLFKLSFRRFKKINDKDSDKKLWQFIGKGKTSAKDYNIWHDYLRHDGSSDALVFIRRVDEEDTYVPGKKGKEPPTLYPEKRMKKSKGEIVAAELSYFNRDESGWNWPFFFAFGFLLACFIYQREVKKLSLIHI